MSGSQKHMVFFLGDSPALLSRISETISAIHEQAIGLEAASNMEAVCSAGALRETVLCIVHVRPDSLDGLDNLVRLRQLDRHMTTAALVDARSEQLEHRAMEQGADLVLRAEDLVPSTVRCLIECALALKRLRAATPDRLQTTASAERLKAISQLASGVAHNFNNLLQTVIGAAQLVGISLEMGDLQSARAHCEKIVRSARFGSETVKRLQNCARLRPDAVSAPWGVFDLSDIVRQAVDMSRVWWKTLPEKEGKTVRMLPFLGRGCMVEGSESELFEVALNLIKNAVEALDHGGEIRVETFVRGDQVVLGVRDSGIGIPRENLGKLFEPFFTTKGPASTGLGLSSSYGIVKRHKGTITVDSTEGIGSSITVILPLSTTITGPIYPVAPPFPLNLRILVIDDLEPVVLTLQDGLVKHGQTVLAAFSGAQGLHLYATNPIDLVICDLGMPGMNGWEVGRKIMAICRGRQVPKTPFILLTGWSGQVEETSRIAESGVDLVIEKPVDISEMMNVIRRLLHAGATG